MGELWPLEIAVRAVEFAKVGIGQELVVQDVVAVRAEDAVGVVMGLLLAVLLVGEAEIFHRIVNLDAGKNRQIAVGNDGGLWHLGGAVEHELVGGVGLAVAIHLIAEKIGENDDLWANVTRHMLEGSFIDFEDGVFCPTFCFGAPRKQEMMPCRRLAPVGLVRTWPYFSWKIFVMKEVVRVLPLVPVTMTVR